MTDLNKPCDRRIGPTTLRKTGPQSSPPVGSLAREDYLLAMPGDEFEAWVDSRLRGAYGTPSEADEFRSVEADRRLRAWASDGGALAGPRHAAADSASESPLESMLLEAFFASGFFDRLAVPSDVVVGSGPFGLLLQQVTVPGVDRRYRLDFAIMNAAEGVFLAVEVDGHEWHDTTPQQAQNDRQRDRRLTASGWTVVRFTGREVYRDAAACVTEVATLLAGRGSVKVG